ncbi:MAG TPA: PepSY domain-containing protein [Steroidobacteraceae bacterium]|nr:PepSY domain-containing protein [Steroidobacteraceae bacterium]
MVNRPLLAAGIASLATGISVLAIQVGAQQAAPPTPAAAAPAGVLGLGDIESRLTALGIRIREIELRDLVVEVEGRDPQGRKVELLIDRRSGEILSQKPDR